MNTRFSRQEILSARQYWNDLTYSELLYFWRHYTTGKGAGMYTSVDARTSFLDYLVLSASESEYCRIHDI